MAKLACKPAIAFLRISAAAEDCLLLADKTTGSEDVGGEMRIVIPKLIHRGDSSRYSHPGVPAYILTLRKILKAMLFLSSI